MLSLEDRKLSKRLLPIDQCGHVATRTGADRHGDIVDREWDYQRSYWYAWRRLRSHADAEDVTQSAYLDWSTRGYVIPARYAVNRAIGRLIRSRNADLAKTRRVTDLAETHQQVTSVTIPLAEIYDTVRSMLEHASPQEATYLQAVLDSDGVVSHAATLLGCHAARIWESLAAIRSRLSH